MSDPTNPYAYHEPATATTGIPAVPPPPVAEPASDGLGSLAQSARTDHLKSARTTMYVIGALTLAVNLIFMSIAPASVEREIDAEVKRLQAQGMEFDDELLAQNKQQAIRTTQLTAGGFAVMGLIFFVLGMLIYRYPVPCTVLALVLYLGGAAITGILDPSTIAKGIIVKIIIIVALVKAAQAAAAYQREQVAAAT